MNITIEVEEGRTTTVYLDEQGGKITLRAVHPQHVVFKRRDADGGYHSSLETTRDGGYHSSLDAKRTDIIQQVVIEITEPGIHEIKADFLANTGGFEVYKVEAEAHVVIEVKAPAAEGGSFKAELEAVLAESFALEEKRIEAEIAKYYKEGTDRLTAAAIARTRVAKMSSAFPVPEYDFEASAAAHPKNTKQMFPEFAKTPVLKGLLKRFSDNQITVTLFERNANFGMELSF